MRLAKIIAFTGAFGSGKSNFCSYLATELKKNYASPLWANYGLAGSIPIRTIQELYGCGYPVGPWGVIVIDELHDTIDSRASSGMANNEFLTWFMQCRKQQSDVLFCTQVLDQVDKRVRRMCSAEFNFNRIGEYHAQVDSYAIDLDGLRCRRISSRVWDFRLAADLYNTYERAWQLEAAPKAQQGAATGRVSNYSRSR